MGDKSPKSISRKNEQAAVQKTQKQKDAHAKAHPEPQAPPKRGK